MKRRSVSMNRTSDNLPRTTSLPVPGAPASRTENCIEFASHWPVESFAILTTNIEGNPASTISLKLGSQAIAAHEFRKFPSAAVARDFEPIAQILSEDL